MLMVMVTLPLFFKLGSISQKAKQPLRDIELQ